MSKDGAGRNGAIGPGQDDGGKGVGDEGPEMKDEVRDFLGKKLRAHYQGLVEQPLPDKFTRLLAELSKSDGETKKGS